MKTYIAILLEIEGADVSTAYEAVDDLLDVGVPQESINDSLHTRAEDACGEAAMLAGVEPGRTTTAIARVLNEREFQTLVERPAVLP